MLFKNTVFFIVGSLVIILIQFVLTYFLRGSFFYLYLPLLYLFIISIHSNSFKGVWCGAFLGLLTDIFDPSLAGVNLLTFALFGLIAGFLNNKKWRLNRLVKSFLFLLLTHIIFYLSILIGISFRRGGFLYADALVVYSHTYMPSIFITFFAIHVVMHFTEKEKWNR